jgi:microcystin-dependent protein
MAGLFPSIANSQNVDINGRPLAGSTLSVFQGGTTTLADCFQDIGLAIRAQNPMIADATSRLPIFYVDDGVYRVRLVDQYGVEIYDYPQVASIGASSSGGGGAAVDPTTVFKTGDVMFLDVDGLRTGWVRDNGRTIGSATSGATERANADCQALFLFGWAAGWTVPAGRGASAAADWAANKTITLPDKRGCGPRGMDTMGNAAAGLFASVPFVSGSETVAGSVAGENTHALTTPEIPAHTHTFTGDALPTHTHSYLKPTFPGGNGAAGGAAVNSAADNPGATSAGTPTGTNSNTGGGGVHNNVARDVIGTWYRKL